MKSIRMFVAVAVTLVIAGCATSQKQNVYHTGSVQQQMRVKLATVIDVREVAIEARPTGTGAAAGATAGAVAATGVDTRHGVIAGIAGAVVGGVAGAVAEKTINSKVGQEIIYQIDGATETLALVQEVDDSPLKAGDRVRLIEGSFAARLVRLGGGSK